MRCELFSAVLGYMCVTTGITMPAAPPVVKCGRVPPEPLAPPPNVLRRRGADPVPRTLTPSHSHVVRKANYGNRC